MCAVSVDVVLGVGRHPAAQGDVAGLLERGAGPFAVPDLLELGAGRSVHGGHRHRHAGLADLLDDVGISPRAGQVVIDRADLAQRRAQLFTCADRALGAPLHAVRSTASAAKETTVATVVTRMGNPSSGAGSFHPVHHRLTDRAGIRFNATVSQLRCVCFFSAAVRAVVEAVLTTGVRVVAARSIRRTRQMLACMFRTGQSTLSAARAISSMSSVVATRMNSSMPTSA